MEAAAKKRATAATKGSAGAPLTRRYKLRLYPSKKQQRWLREISYTNDLIWNSALEQLTWLRNSYEVYVGADESIRLLFRPRHSRTSSETPNEVQLKRGMRHRFAAYLEHSAGKRTPIRYHDRVGKGGQNKEHSPEEGEVFDGAGVKVIDQQRQLQEARMEGLTDLGIGGSVPAQVANHVLRRLHESIIAHHKTPGRGRPRFRPAGKRISINFPSYGQSHKVLRESGKRSGKLQLAGSKQFPRQLVRFRCERPLEDYALGELTVYERNGRWHGSIVIKEAARAIEPPQRIDPDRVLGIDRGITDIVACSNGWLSGPVRICKRTKERKLRLQRQVSRLDRINNAPHTDAIGRLLPGHKRVHSKRRNALVQQAARCSERDKNIREEQAHEIANRLLDLNPQVIAIEQLNIPGMSKSAKGTIEEPGKSVAAKRGLNRAIQEASWGRLGQIIRYKAEERGVIVQDVDARGTSQTCSSCGFKDPGNRPKGRDHKAFKCLSCGHSEDADINAAKNIRTRALKAPAIANSLLIKKASRAKTKPNSSKK